MDKIKQRMKIGLERYGHGLRIHDDTRQWGTKENSWNEMAEEEILDALIYVAAHRLRENTTVDGINSTDDNEKIKKVLINSDDTIIQKLWEIHRLLSG